MDNGNAPRRTFAADQAAAENERATRDAEGWDLNVRNGKAHAAAEEGTAAEAFAHAHFWMMMARLVMVAIVLGAVTAIEWLAGWGPF